MAEHRDEQPAWIARIDSNLRNLLPVAKAEVRPRLSGVRGFVNPVAYRKVRTLQTFAAPDVNNVRIRRRNRDRPNRSGRLIIEDRRPGAPIIVGLPHAAVHRANVENIRLTRHSRRRSRAPASKRPDRSPPHLAEHLRIVGFGTCYRCRRHQNQTQPFQVVSPLAEVYRMHRSFMRAILRYG